MIERGFIRRPPFLELESRKPGRYDRVYDLRTSPCPTVTTIGLAFVTMYYLSLGLAMTDDSSTSLALSTNGDGKPAYQVPTMAEIAAVPANGLRAVSTFSGCGGSCLGLEMAGFDIGYANEFVEAAEKTYRLNHPGVHVDSRDIRQVATSDILNVMGLKKGELDLLEGSPPCASFSTAGSREKHWGQVRVYSQTKQRTDDLFWEFARLLEDLQPRAFLAENVSGLVKGTAKGYFKEILARLRDCGYVVEARVVDAQWLGVPQMRQRVIFQGMRNDLGLKPKWPEPLAYQYSVADACPWLDPASGVEHPPTDDEPPPASLAHYAIGPEWEKLKPGEQSKKYFQLVRVHPQKPCPTVSATGGTVGAATVTPPYFKRTFTITELKRICSFPDDFKLTGNYRQQWERLGRSVPPLMMRAIASCVRDRLNGVA